MAHVLAVSDLASLGAPPELVEVWNKHVRELTGVQERPVRAGALDGQTNMLVVAPTSSGKTFVGELAATSSAYTPASTRSSSSRSGRLPTSVMTFSVSG